MKARRIGRVSLCLLAAYELGGGGIGQLPILLAKIGKNEPCDLVGSLGLVKSMHGRVLSAIEYCAENAEHPCKSKLAWRLFSQAIAR